MTVCIAGTCNLDNDEHGIILCADWQLSGSLGKAETKLKVRSIGKGFWALTSGYESEINALLRIYRDTFRGALSVTEANIAELIRTPLRIRKREKAEEYVSGRFAMSYDDFLKFGKTQLPDDLFREAVFEISKLQLKAEFIIAGFVYEDDPILAETYADGSIALKEMFACIGESAYLATASLMNREFMGVSPEKTAIYQIFEAKTYAQRVTSVGEYTSIYIIDKNRKRRSLTSKGITYLRAKVEELGPKKIERAKIAAEFQPDFFED